MQPSLSGLGSTKRLLRNFWPTNPRFQDPSTRDQVDTVASRLVDTIRGGRDEARTLVPTDLFRVGVPILQNDDSSEEGGTILNSGHKFSFVIELNLCDH